MTYRPGPTSNLIYIPKSKVPKENRKVATDSGAKTVDPVAAQLDLVRQKQRQARAITELNEATLGADKELHAREEQDKKNWRTGEPDFEAAAEEIKQRYLTGITHPDARTEFERRFKELFVPRHVSLRKSTIAAEVAHNRNVLDEAATFYADRAKNAATEFDRRDATRKHELLVRSTEGSGSIWPHEATSRLQDFDSLSKPVQSAELFVGQPSFKSQNVVNTAAARSDNAPRSDFRKDEIDGSVIAQATETQTSKAEKTVPVPRQKPPTLAFEWTSPPPGRDKVRAPSEFDVRSDLQAGEQERRRHQLNEARVRKTIGAKLQGQNLGKDYDEIEVPDHLKQDGEGEKAVADFLFDHPTGDPLKPPHKTNPSGKPHTVSEEWHYWAAHRIYWRVRDAGYSDAVARGVLLNALAESRLDFGHNPNNEDSRGQFQIKVNRGKKSSLGTEAIDAGKLTDPDRLFYDLDYNIDILLWGMEEVGADLKNNAKSMEFAMWKLVTTVFKPEEANRREGESEASWIARAKKVVMQRLDEINKFEQYKYFKNLPPPDVEPPTGWADISPPSAWWGYEIQ